MTRCLVLLLLALVGCGQGQPQPSVPALPAAPGSSGTDAAKVRDSDFSILFVGNSHTTFHDLPELVCQMIRHRLPGKSAYCQTISVGHLEGLAHDPRGQQELDAHPWKFVVLQAQKISASGTKDYPRDDGLAFATRAKAKGAKVFFFSEWGLRGRPDNGPHHEQIYREMAEATGTEVAAVGRAWDLALAERPELPLHADDGNHQSRTGAFLTACVLCGRITGEDPAPLASFPDPVVDEPTRKFLAEVASKSLAGK